MGKYDWITKEQLEDLYIKQNLSKPEIRNILGISSTHCGRLLEKFGIKKSEKQLKELQSRIAHSINDNLSEEKRQSRINKCREASKHNTNGIDVLKRINANRSEEHRQKLIRSQHEFYKNESEENKLARKQKVSIGTKKAMQALSDEKKLEIVTKRNLAVANRTSEQKAESLKKLRATWAAKTDEEKLEIYKRQAEARIKTGSFQSSTAEKEIRSFIESFGFKTEHLIEGAGTNRFELDIYIPELKLAIEYNGVYWHSTNGPNTRTKNYHYNKSMLAKEKGIDLIHVWEDLWNDKKDLIKTILMSRLNVLTQSKIYARKCTIKEIDTNTYKQFCEENHVQGYRVASVKLGLFYEGKLVQIASFNRTKNIGKQNRKEEWEWIRGCPASINSVIGGTSKLFSYFVRNYSPKSVICYADWNLFNGNGYTECGFVFDGFTGPDKFYYDTTAKTRIARNPYKYREFKEQVKSNKLFECYGAGSKRFIWTKHNDEKLNANTKL